MAAPGGVPEWLIGADCKSAALRATQVRILPPPPSFKYHRILTVLSRSIRLEHIGVLEFQCLGKEVVDGFKDIQDVILTVSDVLD